MDDRSSTGDDDDLHNNSPVPGDVDDVSDPESATPDDEYLSTDHFTLFSDVFPDQRVIGASSLDTAQHSDDLQTEWVEERVHLQTNMKNDLEFFATDDSSLSGYSDVESTASDSSVPPSPQMNIAVPAETPVQPLTANLSNLKTKCLTASCRLNPKSIQEDWDHDKAEEMVYYEGEAIESLRLVEMVCEIKDANKRPCLWGCKDSNGRPLLLSGTY
jgi:hypothetical protein